MSNTPSFYARFQYGSTHVFPVADLNCIVIKHKHILPACFCATALLQMCNCFLIKQPDDTLFLARGELVTLFKYCKTNASKNRNNKGLEMTKL